ncbi:hypothetical protein KNP414_05402 [Paenibacillus mucilaginosus KNP414]|uniref:Uncharacterized protein n=1 Tax=Paenibacillus mucilaginosus (strain KNP414) TaxID=1036673 RepID=F8FGA6_PAEMK|nr:hypothetical protein KNP414_05402 [Paenibacillus mucilaginosus KNP414]
MGMQRLHAQSGAAAGIRGQLPRCQRYGRMHEAGRPAVQADLYVRMRVFHIGSAPVRSKNPYLIHFTSR